MTPHTQTRTHSPLGPPLKAPRVGWGGWMGLWSLQLPPLKRRVGGAALPWHHRPASPTAWGRGSGGVPNPEGVPGGFGAHRTPGTSTHRGSWGVWGAQDPRDINPEGSLWGLGCPDPQGHQPRGVPVGFGVHRTPGTSTLGGLGCPDPQGHQSQGVSGGFGVHRTPDTSTPRGPCGVLGCPDPQGHQPGMVTVGFGGHRDPVLGIPVGFGVHIMGLIHGLILFSPPFPHPSSAAWPWGTLWVGEGEGSCFMDCLGGGGCLCSMSVLLKSLFIIRNITPTYVQPCLALCFGEGSCFLEAGGSLGMCWCHWRW
nr:collagen alpha-1(XXVIII) chain-like [Taeniopygia guttata]